MQCYCINIILLFLAGGKAGLIFLLLCVQQFTPPVEYNKFALSMESNTTEFCFFMLCHCKFVSFMMLYTLYINLAIQPSSVFTDLLYIFYIR